MAQFKGTKAKWIISPNSGGFIADETDKFAIAKVFENLNINAIEAKANAQLIVCAPEMFKELNETIIDLNILRNQLLDALKTNHLFGGMPELLDEWIERKKQLIVKATK